MSNFSKANELYYLDQYEEAIKLFKLCEELPNDDVNKPLAFYNTGVCYIQLKQYESACAWLERATTLKEDSKYYFNLGYCCTMMKLNQDALKYFRIALKLDPSDKDTIKAIRLLKEHDTEELDNSMEELNFNRHEYPVDEDCHIDEFYDDDLSSDDRLDILKAEINMALDIKDKGMFMALSEELNHMQNRDYRREVLI